MDKVPEPTPRVLGIDEWAKRKGLITVVSW